MTNLMPSTISKYFHTDNLGRVARLVLISPNKHGATYGVNYGRKSVYSIGPCR